MNVRRIWVILLLTSLVMGSSLSVAHTSSFMSVKPTWMPGEMAASRRVLNAGVSVDVPVDTGQLSAVQAGIRSDIVAASLDDWVARSVQNDSALGLSVRTAGDVNGDGYADVIVGAPAYNNGEVGEGMAFVWYGSYDGLGADGTPGNADWSAEANQNSAHFGWSVGTAGDVNGDGYDDVIVGAPQYKSGVLQGRVFVWYGASNGLGANGTPANADWWAQVSGDSGGQFGWSVGTAGDVNNDGYDDIIVGAPYYSHGELWEGGVFVWYGGPNGLGGNNRTPDWQVESDRYQGEDNPMFGGSVGTAGDVNGDGYDDILVGAYCYGRGQGGGGRAFVWYGSAGGIKYEGKWWAESDVANANFGFSVSTAGDVNGDGYDDIIVGAPFYWSDEQNRGRAFIWYGSPGGLGDNGNPSNADWWAQSALANTSFGFSVGAVGDFDNDGYGDIVVGEPAYYQGTNQGIGATHFWCGSASGPSSNGPDFSNKPALQPGSHYGESVGAAGDVNGDSFDDLIVGAPYASGPATRGGHAYVQQGEGTPNWAFLLYVDGDNNLGPSVRDTVQNLEAVSANPNLTVLVLLDDNDIGDTWRYHVQPGGHYTDNVNRWFRGELDMSNPQTLSEFITWARGNYPAKHYYLAVADHGRGTSGIAQDETSGNTIITVAELRTALRNATSDGSNPLDVVHYDACLMAMLENAYQIRDYAAYLVASENEGWSLFAYELYAAQVTGDTTPEQLSTIVVDKYHNAVAGLPRTISALDLSQAGATTDAVSDLATALQISLGANKYYVTNTRTATQKFDSRHYCEITVDDEYLDLYDFARLIRQNHPDASVKNHAQALMDAVNALVVAERHQSGGLDECKDEFDVVHRNVYWDLDDAHGVSIYFPPAPGVWGYDDYTSHVSFRFTVDGQWDEFLQDYFGLMGLPPEEPVDPGLAPMLPVMLRIFLPLVVGGG